MFIKGISLQLQSFLLEEMLKFYRFETGSLQKEFNNYKQIMNQDNNSDRVK